MYLIFHPHAFREYTCFSFWLCWLNGRCIRGTTVLEEQWDHEWLFPPPHFSLQSKLIISERLRKSKAVKLANPATFRKLHLKTDIKIAGNRIFQILAFKSDCLQRSNHAWPTLKYAPRFLFYASPTRTYPVR